MEKSAFDVSHQNNHVESKIIVAFEKITQAFRVMLWNESKKHQLSPIQVQILVFLLHHDSTKNTISYLANEFHMTKATISDSIKTLEQKKLVSKFLNSSDGRSYSINLTDLGKKTALETSKFTTNLLPAIAPITDKEDFLKNLFQIIQHLNESNIVTIQRMCFTCQYYRENYNNAQHYCKLMDTAIQNHEIRLDCPEHLS